MKTVDFGIYFVVYNFIIGVLLMIASEKLGTYASYLTTSYKTQFSRITQFITFTFGACVALVSGGLFSWICFKAIA